MTTPQGPGRNILGNLFRSVIGAPPVAPAQGPTPDTPIPTTPHEDAQNTFADMTGGNVHGTKIGHLAGRLRTAMEAERTSRAALLATLPGGPLDAADGVTAYYIAVGRFEAFADALAWAENADTGELPGATS